MPQELKEKELYLGRKFRKILIRDRTEAELEVISKTGKAKKRKGKWNTWVDLAISISKMYMIGNCIWLMHS